MRSRPLAAAKLLAALLLASALFPAAARADWGAGAGILALGVLALTAAAALLCSLLTWACAHIPPGGWWTFVAILASLLAAALVLLVAIGAVISYADSSWRWIGFACAVLAVGPLYYLTSSKLVQRLIPWRLKVEKAPSDSRPADPR
jgi:hypothetical protein